jgi:hypothetical protein
MMINDEVKVEQILYAIISIICGPFTNTLSGQASAVVYLIQMEYTQTIEPLVGVEYIQPLHKSSLLLKFTSLLKHGN